MNDHDDAHLQGRSPKDPAFYDPIEGHPLNNLPSGNDTFIDQKNLCNGYESYQSPPIGIGTLTDTSNLRPDTEGQLNYAQFAILPKEEQLNHFGYLDT